MRSKALVVGLSLLLVALLVGACGPAPQQLVTPEQPSKGVASISVDKMVKVEGGDTWEGEVEQCVCQNVQFRIIITNNGDVHLSNIYVSDALSGYLSYVQGTASPTPDSTAPYIIWNFPGPIQPGDAVEITFSAHVSDEGTHTNCVKVQAGTDDGEVVNDDDCAVVVGVACEPEHKMHYPQYPDVDGWDVFSCDSWAPDEDIQVADDWKCSETGLVENIRFWGSWKDGVEGQITGFHIEIYNNNPGGDYSHPDDLLWDAITDYSSEAFELVAFEGWYNPWTDFHEDFDHNTYYQYDITDIQDAFWQEEGNIYWLSIWPVIDGVGVWGWKSSEDHWMDDACWRRFDSPPPGPWQDLYEPTVVVQSLDLAFIIYGGEVPCQCGEWEEITISSGDWQEAVNCGETINTPLDVGVVEATASYICAPPEDCEATYKWAVDPLGINGECNSSPCVFEFELLDECVKVYISTFCGGTLCDECAFGICPEEPCGVDSMIVPSLITNTELYDCTGCEFNNFEYYVAEVPPSLQAPTWNQDLVTNYGAQWLFCMACCNVYTGGELVPSTGDKIYKFLTSFEIPQECTVDSTTLKITADDFVTEVMLNGNSVDLTTNPSGTTDSSAEEEVHTYLIDPSWFAPGSNTFTVELKDCFGSDPLCGAGHIGGIWCLVIYFQ